MGLSPELATSILRVCRSALSSMEPSSIKYSPGIMVASLWNGVMDGDEFRAVRKSCLDLDVMDHFRHALHDLFAGQQCRAVRHEVGDCSSLARPFQQGGRDVGDNLGIVQLQAFRLSPLCKQSGRKNQEFVLFTR